MLNALIFTKRLPFQIWPYDVNAFPGKDPGFEYHNTILFGMAIQYNLKTLASTLCDKSSNRESVDLSESISHHWQGISEWASTFWIDKTSQHVTPKILHQLYVDYGGTHPTEQNWKGWTYFQIINAIAEAKDDSIEILLSAWDLKIASGELAHSYTFYGHIILHAVLHSRVSLIKSICVYLQDWQMTHVDWLPNTLFPRTRYDDLDCNAFEVAHLQLNSESALKSITAFAESVQLSPSSDFHESLFASDRIRDAVVNCNTLQLVRLIRAMGVTEQIISDVEIISIFYSPNQSTRSVDDAKAIKCCVHYLRPPNSGTRRTSIFGEMYSYKIDRKHWISKFEVLNHRAKIDLMLLAMAKPSLEDGRYLLQDAIEHGAPQGQTSIHVKRVERLVAVGVPITGSSSVIYRDEDDLSHVSILNVGRVSPLTPVYYSIFKNQHAIASILINKGALAAEPSMNEWSPFHFAIISGSSDMFRLLVSSPGAVAFAPNMKQPEILRFLNEHLRYQPRIREEILGLIRGNQEIFRKHSYILHVPQNEPVLSRSDFSQI